MEAELGTEIASSIASSGGSGVGAIGAIVAAMGCANCFPAIAALGASLGLGFLEQYEGMIINRILPIFVIIAMIANLYLFNRHRIIWRGILSLIGPVLVLAKFYLFWSAEWSNAVFYVGLAFMVGSSIFDIVSPPLKRCPVPKAAA